MAGPKGASQSGAMSEQFLRANRARLAEIGRYRAERDASGLVIRWRNPARLARWKPPVPMALEFSVQRHGRDCDPDYHVFLLMARVTDGLPGLLRQAPRAVMGAPDPDRSFPTVGAELRRAARCGDPEAVLRVERLMPGGRPSYGIHLVVSFIGKGGDSRLLRFDFDAYALTVSNAEEYGDD